VALGLTLVAVPGDLLEAALDELYADDPSEFVATRKRLIADLRAAGDKVAEALAERERETRSQANLAWREAALQRAATADADATRAETRIADLQSELVAARWDLRDANSRKRTAAAEADRITP